MGKSKIDKMRPSHLMLRIENQIDTKSWKTPSPEEKANNKKTLPQGLESYAHQVGGHMTDGIHLGLMKCNGKVYKPVTSKICGDREIEFYEKLRTTTDPVLLEFRNFVPKYYGTETFVINGKDVKCLVLDDITKDVKEPCVMDVKIGKITYDPLATPEKIMNENSKYKEIKRELGIAIPGFQVYKISNGRICKFGKDYGKKLNKETAIDAFRIFLNGGTCLNRSLLMQLLTALWRIQNWARKQNQIRLISSSLLLVYDARKLRQAMNKSNPDSCNGSANSSPRPKLHRANSLSRPISIISPDKLEQLKSGFSGQLSNEGPILACPSSPTRIRQYSPLADKRASPSLKRMHSFQNNYDKDLQNMKLDYNAILDELVCDKRNQIWATVKVIDFAHVFPAENGAQDSNFLEGLGNLIKVFEGFLFETDLNFMKET